MTPLPQFDPHEVAHRDDCYEIEPGRFCDCPTLGELRERSMDISGLLQECGPVEYGIQGEQA